MMQGIVDTVVSEEVSDILGLGEIRRSRSRGVETFLGVVVNALEGVDMGWGICQGSRSDRKKMS